MTTHDSPAAGRPPLVSEWGRWGADDQRGRFNLVTSQKVLEGVAAVSDGTRICLSRPLRRGPQTPDEELRSDWTSVADHGAFGVATDFVGVWYHGVDNTHLDALCHVWEADGLWNGRDPSQEVRPEGAAWGDVAQWRTGIITRGVLLDIPGLRETEYVTRDQPVTVSDLRAAARKQQVEVRAGDALIVYGGRELWTAEFGDYAPGQPRPGLDDSCLTYVKETDVAAVCWDIMDAFHSEGVPFTVHRAIWAYGVALIDNAYLTHLVEECRRRGKWDMLFIVAPLVVEGGTGSPVNPIVIL